MKNIAFVIFLIISIIIFAASTFIDKNNFEINENTPVAEVLLQLGEPTPGHTQNNETTKDLVAIGKNIVLNGLSSRTGEGGRRQSKHFVCTSCHNVQREDPILSVSDPEARLEYAQQNGLPFLQGTTLHGVVNRESWYNGDYDKKYDPRKIKPAQTDLREAIQLCATECAQGRELKDWELEGVLAYLWTLELKMDDLDLSNADLQRIENGINDASQRSELVQFIKSKYSQASPATFIDQPDNLEAGYQLKGNADKGKLVYDLSCKHCHENGRYSMFVLGDSKMDYRFMKRNFTKYTRYSTYHVISYGYATNGKRQYMPNYTLERMSRQQIEDLRAFFERESE